MSAAHAFALWLVLVGTVVALVGAFGEGDVLWLIGMAVSALGALLAWTGRS